LRVSSVGRKRNRFSSREGEGLSIIYALAGNLVTCARYYDGEKHG